MAHSVESSSRTQLTQLRESLDKAERLIVQVDAYSVEDFLTLLDNIEGQFDELAESGIDLRPEQSRWEGLLNRINNQPGRIVRFANAAGGMGKLRGEHPPAESFWWHLDREVARRRARSFRQLITTLVTVALLAVGGYWAINYFFPPNPEAVLMVETNSSLDRLIVEERWQDALDLVKATRAELPNNAELLLWEVVLNERLGDAEATAAAMAAAEEALAGNPVELWLTLGNNRLRAGDLDGAQAAGEEALALDPNNAQVYFLLGGVAEAKGDLGVAITYFEQTFQLAEGQNPQLAVIARVRMGNLLQNPGSLVSPEATPTPTP
jgi:tetratricopeptide (TPR) repeat protein